MRILFAGWPIACEMGVLKVFILDLLHENQNLVCWQEHCILNGCISLHSCPTVLNMILAAGTTKYMYAKIYRA